MNGNNEKNRWERRKIHSDTKTEYVRVGDWTLRMQRQSVCFIYSTPDIHTHIHEQPHETPHDLNVNRITLEVVAVWWTSDSVHQTPKAVRKCLNSYEFHSQTRSFILNCVFLKQLFIWRSFIHFNFGNFSQQAPKSEQVCVHLNLWQFRSSKWTQTLTSNCKHSNPPYDTMRTHICMNGQSKHTKQCEATHNRTTDKWQ